VNLAIEEDDDTTGSDRRRPPARTSRRARVETPVLSVCGASAAKLHALSQTQRGEWRVITDAIDCYARGRSSAERRLIAALARRSRDRSQG
jgi:hypothetical protein